MWYQYACLNDTSYVNINAFAQTKQDEVEDWDTDEDWDLDEEDVWIDDEDWTDDDVWCDGLWLPEEAIG